MASASGKAAIARFLAGGGGGEGAAPPTRLFVWVPRSGAAGGADGEWDVAHASTETLDGGNLGAVAFVNTAVTAAAGAAAGPAPVRTAGQLQCMTICPRMYEEEEEKGEGGGPAGGGEGEEAAAEPGPASGGPGSATFLSLQMYARHCFVPAVQAIEALDVDEKKDADEAPAAGAGADPAPVAVAGEPSSKKKSRILEGLEDKIRELDVALGQCRRSVLGQIPHVVLRAHPVVAASAGAIPSSGKMDMAELGLAGRMDDDAFLNEVQSGVSAWIGKVRKVTVLPSTTPFPSGGDVDSETNAGLEEVTFWTELEIALKNIRAELAKPEVRLTIAMLKEAKRFLATIALENNTGLDSAEAHATDVANYVRTYPIDALVAARDMVKIGNAMDSIFEHIPRIRQSRFYDLERCARLLEATTLTLRQRMGVILRDQNKGNRIVLGLPFEDYEKEIRFPTQDIFVRFDDSYVAFTEFLLEQGRKKRVASSSDPTKTPAQVVKSVTLYHQPLRDRLDAIHMFRMQHEKLRAVVTEVLSGENTNDFEEDEDEAAGANAVKEVEIAPVEVFAAVQLLDLSPRGQQAFQSALQRYDRKVDAVEEKLAKLLRDKLTASQVSMYIAGQRS